MRLRDLVAAAMTATGCTSTRELAARMGVSHGSIAFWQREERFPDFENAAELARLAGLDPVSIAAEIRLQSPEGSKHKGLLRRLARVAAALLLGVISGAQTPSASASEHPVSMRQNLDVLYIMRIVRRWLARSVKYLRLRAA